LANKTSSFQGGLGGLVEGEREREREREREKAAFLAEINCIENTRIDVPFYLCSYRSSKNIILSLNFILQRVYYVIIMFIMFM